MAFYQQHQLPNGNSRYSLPVCPTVSNDRAWHQQWQQQQQPLPHQSCIFEMPGESAVSRKECSPKEPGQTGSTKDTDRPIMQANPWPFYLDDSEKKQPSSRLDEAKAEKPEVQDEWVQCDVDGNKEKQNGSKPELMQANPWAYFGPLPGGGDDDDGLRATVYPVSRGPDKMKKGGGVVDGAPARGMTARSSDGEMLPSESPEDELSRDGGKDGDGDSDDKGEKHGNEPQSPQSPGESRRLPSYIPYSKQGSAFAEDDVPSSVSSSPYSASTGAAPRLRQTSQTSPPQYQPYVPPLNRHHMHDAAPATAKPSSPLPGAGYGHGDRRRSVPVPYRPYQSPSSPKETASTDQSDLTTPRHGGKLEQQASPPTPSTESLALPPPTTSPSSPAPALQDAWTPEPVVAAISTTTDDDPAVPASSSSTYLWKAAEIPPPSPPAAASSTTVQGKYDPSHYPLSPAAASQTAAGTQSPPSSPTAPNPSSERTSTWLGGPQQVALHPPPQAIQASPSPSPSTLPFAPGAQSTVHEHPVQRVVSPQPTFGQGAPPQPFQAQMPFQAPPPHPTMSPPPPYIHADLSSSGAPPPPPSVPAATAEYYAPPQPLSHHQQYQYPAQPLYASFVPNGAPPALPPRPPVMFETPPMHSWAGSGPPSGYLYTPPPRMDYGPPLNTPSLSKPSSAGSSGKLFSTASARKWLGKTSAMLENKIDAVFQGQGPQWPPPRPTNVPMQAPVPNQYYYPPRPILGSYNAQDPNGHVWRH